MSSMINVLQITYPDFHLYEMLDHHKALEPSLLDGMDNLKVVKNVHVFLSTMLFSSLFVGLYGAI